MTYVSQTEKKQVTVRMTEQFAKDLNLLLSCSQGESVSGVVQGAVHQQAEYYRFCMARKQDAGQEVVHDPDCEKTYHAPGDCGPIPY